jgi:hypothetical protein
LSGRWRSTVKNAGKSPSYSTRISMVTTWKLAPAPRTWRAQGPGDRFRCPDCQDGQFAIVTSFFFWEASIDLVEDEPEEFEPRAQDLFCEFVAHGQCEKCDRWVRFTDFGKL